MTADTLNDAWWGLGYAAAQDRLWQMEYDRRRAIGRLAEIAGMSATQADVLARRLQLERAAQVDVAAMDDTTRRSFELYADGVNACVYDADRLPPEFAAAGIDFEPWLTWHSIAVFKVRHVLMGVWQYKLTRALLHASEGPGAFATFDPVLQTGMRLTTPAGRRFEASEGALLNGAKDDVTGAAAQLGFLAEVEAGSNAWVVSGARTNSGKPLLVNDSHRAVDVPNVYWQARIRTPQVRVAGATFAGIPGFPHFGHNGRVGWAITNAAADAQDLLTESFKEVDGDLRVRTPSGWSNAETSKESIDVAGGASVAIECTRTPNGPIVHGDPRSGRALSLRWTATDQACQQFHVLNDMLFTSTVHDFLDSQAGWVDPVNNLLCADGEGNIGYLLRGSLPRRQRAASVQIPVPGWEAVSQWDGRIPFADMPREENPPLGFIANANNSVTCGGDGVEVSHSVNDFYRVERIYELLEASDDHDVGSMQRLQADTVSVPARLWSRHLARRGDFGGAAEQARKCLAEWDGDVDAPRPAGLVYACFRRTLAQLLVRQHVSPAGEELLTGNQIPAGGVLLKRWFAQLIWPKGAATDSDDIPDSTLTEALAQAWNDAITLAGSDPNVWRWRNHHHLEPQHPLFWADPDGLPNPKPVAAGGDPETVQAAAYGWARHSPFTVTNTSVYRQILDFSALEQAMWVIPGGANGRPGNPHYDDQMPVWGSAQLIPIHGDNDVTE